MSTRPWILVLALLTLLTPSAYAQEQEAECASQARDCGCPKNWGCWELVYSAKGTVLGVRSTVTSIHGRRDDALDTSVLGVYQMEHYGTRNYITAHVAASAALGGGTASTEGSLASQLSVGFRGEITKVSGPFLRGGMQGLLIKNRSLNVALIEPARAELGYQWLDGQRLLELGMSQGFVAAGRYEPKGNGTRTLRRASELGAHAVLHLASVRVHADYARLFTLDKRVRADVDLGRVSVCYELLPLALCVDGLYVRADAATRAPNSQVAHTVYPGVTIGFTP